LLSNAIRYAPNKPVHVSVTNAGSNVLLMVRDEGKGIALESRERIFNRFERVDASRNVTGLGLGLYICKEIVAAHRGTIHVESTESRGALFIVCLPKLPEKLLEFRSRDASV
ncbi:MAG: sensor histidine kinase, partial [Deltaproteobacteria bacterium]|nr:sensor histidine kinase [Deltaproteobacteria bacterium]